MKRTSSFILSILAVLALAACGDVREDLGLGRSAPDEFAVVDRPPLSVPPDFTLRPPKPGEPRPQEVDMTQRANDILYGTNAKPAGAPGTAVAGSGAEQELLVATGADKADPQIRGLVDHEAAARVVGSDHLVDDLLWWRKNQSPAATVDAKAEAARIKEAKEKGEPLNKSATPVIEKEKSGWLGL